MEWRELQKQNFTQIETLLDYLEFDEELRLKVLKKPRFPLNIPRRLAQKIKKNNINDPIFQQFVPTREEENRANNFVVDPVADSSFRKGRKLLVKYHGRALLVCTKACAMNCRFCFRQNFDYEVEIKGFDEELRLIAEDTSLKEVILSGGDPLSLSNHVLSDLIGALSAIPHVKRLRFHSRFPMGIPERIDSDFLRILETSRLQTVFVIHTNHAQEFDADVLASLKKIQKLGIPVISQSVLLKGVNDTKEDLQELVETLVDHGVMPYYLHQLDRVEGAVHFETASETGLHLMDSLRTLVSGYAVPRYVREVPGELSKTSL